MNFLIDKTKEEFADLPDRLDKEVLLEVTKDSLGKVSGYLTILPELLKHFAETKTSEELQEMGFSKYNDKIDWIKSRDEIKSKAPEEVL